MLLYDHDQHPFRRRARPRPAALRILGHDPHGHDGEAYDAARVAFNGMFNRRPAMIARAASTADVAHALDYTRGGGLAVAVRGGGHYVAGYWTIDGGVVIDLGL